MQIKTDKALISHLLIKQFAFESMPNREHKEQNIAQVIKCFDSCKIVEIKQGKYYRARRIYSDSQGILFENGIPQNGFSSEQSGVAPKENCKSGRATDEYEQVLYFSADAQTAIKEVQTPEFDYASVATCTVDKAIRVFDFSPYSNEELMGYINTSQMAEEDEVFSKGMLFIEMQRILTLKEYSDYEYVVSRNLVKVIKDNYLDVSGIKYVSHYTGKCNYALWDDNKFIRFSPGTIMLND